jgi:hypothetical protein
MAKLTFRPSDDGKLTLLANTFTRTPRTRSATWDGIAPTRAASRRMRLLYNTRKRIEHTQGGIAYEHRFGEQTVHLSAYAGERSVIHVPVDSEGSPVEQHRSLRRDHRFRPQFAPASPVGWSGRFGLAGGQLTTTSASTTNSRRYDRRGYEKFHRHRWRPRHAAPKEDDRVASFDQYAQRVAGRSAGPSPAACASAASPSVSTTPICRTADDRRPRRLFENDADRRRALPADPTVTCTPARRAVSRPRLSTNCSTRTAGARSTSV